MRHIKKAQLTLSDLVRVVSQFSRNDHELGLAVADMINRGRIKLHGNFQHHKVVVS